MILLLEFDCTKVMNIDPLVSNATIMDIRGATCFVGTELVLPFSLHFILLKSVMPNQVLSTFMMVVYFPRSALRSLMANCCRRIKFLIELAFHDIGYIC